MPYDGDGVFRPILPGGVQNGPGDAVNHAPWRISEADAKALDDIIAAYQALADAQNEIGSAKTIPSQHQYNAMRGRQDVLAARDHWCSVRDVLTMLDQPRLPL